jgi:hypothetical protein
MCHRIQLTTSRLNKGGSPFCSNMNLITTGWFESFIGSDQTCGPPCVHLCWSRRTGKAEDGGANRQTGPCLWLHVITSTCSVCITLAAKMTAVSRTRVFWLAHCTVWLWCVPEWELSKCQSRKKCVTKCSHPKFLFNEKLNENTEIIPRLK